ncbi:hypothetical protein DAETH_40370 (plasmid) [Deinococcus aetherius]|uniref:Uncharacterized protein n=1 Tax=Deinococcus aetherius TaxID=200252 RepID=A0ABM8AJR3_9DEIO|nr:hypothetical protein [Deinococcus aetherius]BDP44068.1 hypothetical protein DAETH_40370 [Deinococcus aetherius]
MATRRGGKRGGRGRGVGVPGRKGQRPDEPSRSPAPSESLVGAFDALATVDADFLPEGRQQGEGQEREAF